MQEKARILQQVFENLHCKVWHYPLHDMQPSTLYRSLNAAHSNSEQSTNTSLALNMTGGTKIMALLAANWAYSENIPTFYVDTTEEHILSLHTQPITTYSLCDVLDLDTILAAQGFSIIEKNTEPINKTRHDFLQRFLEIALGGGIPVLNACALVALTQRKLSAPLKSPPRYALLALLEHCKAHNVLDFNDYEIIFASEKDALSCSGFWLEEYVRAKLYALHAHKYIQSWACGVQVHSGTVKNEFDAVFTARNRLFVLECKTAQMQKHESTTGRIEKFGDSSIFKLEALGDKIGGIMVHKMLISLRELTSAQEMRAKSYHLQLAIAKDILQLTEKIQHWIQTCP